MAKAMNTKEKHGKALADAKAKIDANEQKKRKRRNGPLPGEGGAPFKLDDEDKREIYTLAAMGCTVSEIAEHLAVDITCIEKNTTYSGLIKGGKENFKKSLRRMQYTSAKEGNVTMQIWLGKQILGQRDKIEADTTISNPLLERALTSGLASGKDLVKAREADKKFEPIDNVE